MVVAITSLAAGVAVIAIALVGFAAMVGADRIRDGLARVAVVGIATTIFIPYVARVFARTEIGGFQLVGNNLEIWPAVIVGYVGLLLAWVESRIGPPEFVANIERGRGRGRERVTPALERGRDE